MNINLIQEKHVAQKVHNKEAIACPIVVEHVHSNINFRINYAFVCRCLYITMKQTYFLANRICSMTIGL